MAALQRQLWGTWSQSSKKHKGTLAECLPKPARRGKVDVCRAKIGAVTATWRWAPLCRKQSCQPQLPSLQCPLHLPGPQATPCHGQHCEGCPSAWPNLFQHSPEILSNPLLFCPKCQSLQHSRKGLHADSYSLLHPSRFFQSNSRTANPISHLFLGLKMTENHDYGRIFAYSLIPHPN